MKIAPEPSTSNSTPGRCPIHPNIALGSRRSQCPICATKRKRRRGKSLAPGARHGNNNESHVSSTRIHRCDDKQQGWKWNEKIDVRNIMNKTGAMPTKSNATRSNGSRVALPFRQPRASSDVQHKNGNQEKSREPSGFKVSKPKAKQTSSQRSTTKKPDPRGPTRACSRSERYGPAEPSSPCGVSEVPRDEVSQPKQVGRSSRDQQKDDNAIRSDRAFDLTCENTDRQIKSTINYGPGQNLYSKEHSIPFASSSQAYTLMTKLPLYSPLFVKRTSGEWTCGLLADRLMNHRGTDRLIVFFKSSGEKKKILEKMKWKKYLRLVKGHAASEALLSHDAAADADRANGRKPRGRGKQSAVSRMISRRKKSISRSLSRSRSRRRASTKPDRRAKHAQKNRYNDAGSTSYGGATLAPSITSATIDASASLTGSFVTISSSAISFRKRSLALRGPPTESVSFCSDAAPSSDDIIMNMDMVNADLPAVAAEPSNNDVIINMDMVNADPPPVAANNGGIPRRKNQEFDRSSAGKTSRSRSHRHRAGGVARSTPQPPTNDPSPSPDQAPSSLPVATNVNLKAKTFCGNRRDRMRPRARRTRSKSRVRVFSPSCKARLGR